MSGYILKDPNHTHISRMQFRGTRLRPSETVVGDRGWLIKALNDTRGEARVVAQVISPDFSEAVIEGGCPGDIFAVTSEVDTSHGRILKKSFILRIGRAANSDLHNRATATERV